MSIVDAVQQFVEEDDSPLLQAVEKFCLAHADEFGKRDEVRLSSEEDTREYDVEYWETYQRFLRVVEAQLERFLHAEGSSPAAFVRELRERQASSRSKGDDTCLRVLDAFMDFDIFLAMVHDVRRTGRL